MNELAKVLIYYNLIDISCANKIICPFHEDVNPSMIINYNENFWFCFGCNLKGNALDFVKIIEKKYNKLNDLKATKKYYDILKSKKVSNIKFKHHVKSVVSNEILYDEAHDYYYGLKSINWMSPVEQEVISCKDYMINRGFSEKSLNLVKAKFTYNNSYPIIFPMLDNGKFRGWVCRTNNPKVEKVRKYLYNEGFSRATTLVGNYGKYDYVIVVEGYMDRLKFLQYGQKNVVAILGWKMSAQQIQKLKDAGVKYIISALDNDIKGKEGTMYLKNFFKVINFAYLKGVKDPGEMNEVNFKKMLNKTKSIFKKERGNLK